MTAYLGRPTGSNVHWVWTGSSWNLLAYGGGSSGGTGVVTSSVTTTLLYPFTATTGSFIVPAGITSVQVKMWGPGGGNGCYSTNTAGAGGFTSGTISVTPGEELLLIVGGGGAGVTGTTGNGGNGGYGNGGFGTKGDASGGGGGGYTGIFTASIDQANAIMIAGGGGGATGFFGGGGGGGGTTGGNGNNGLGGTQTAGGGGGTTGGRLFGGKGLGSQTVSTANDDGGGGSGYWGGGGGSGDGRSGGGGSGFILASRVTLSGTIAGSNGNSANTRALPPMTSDLDYLTIVSASAAPYSLYGVGTGGNSIVSSIGFDGGHGFIIIRYTSGQNIALWFEGSPNTAYITSSIAIGLTGSAQTKGTDNFLYVSGTIGTTGSSARKAVFGGDTFTSGSSVSAFGFSGSLTRLSNGQSYITASDGISVTSASNGQVGIGLASRIFAYDLDFTLLNSLSLSNGANTIDGKTWQGSNSGAASTFDILSGTGLRIFNNTTNSDYNNGTRTAPILETRITDFYPDYDPGKHRVRFWVQFTHTADQNFETARLGFERSGSETTQNFQTGKQFNGSNVWFSTTTSTATSTGFSDDSSDNAHDVGVVEFFNYSEMVSLSGLYSGSDWPTPNQLKIRNRASQFNVNGGIKSPSDLAVFVCSSTANANGNMQMVVKKIRIEIR